MKSRTKTAPRRWPRHDSTGLRTDAGPDPRPPSDIEAEEGIRILFAIESGSRAWGFHSPDSDYDVRFVYTRPLDWHLKLGKRRDVVERPIDDELDLSGWELSKALTLTLGSNAVIAEWLQSPVTYVEDRAARQVLTDFAARALDRKSVSWHYLSLLRRQLSRLDAPGGGIRLKRFFYVLRPTLALRWMRLHDRPMPPMDMTALRSGAALSPDEADALDRLTLQKMAARERATGDAPDPVLFDLVARETAAAETWLASAPQPDRSALWGEAEALHRRLTLDPP
ncbi:MAG: nucleotidyltransferase domain-containing protein [Paracoccaceae bacterium]